MLNVVSLLPHCKKDSKVESKSTKGATLNELVELKSCSSCLFFEVSVQRLFPFAVCSYWLSDGRGVNFNTMEAKSQKPRMTWALCC